MFILVYRIDDIDNALSYKQFENTDDIKTFLAERKIKQSESLILDMEIVTSGVVLEVNEFSLYK